MDVSSNSSSSGCHCGSGSARAVSSHPSQAAGGAEPDGFEQWAVNGQFFDELTSLGLRANKMTVNWDPANPLEIREKAFLDRSIPWATAQGIHLSFGIHIGKARAITGSPSRSCRRRL